MGRLAATTAALAVTALVCATALLLDLEVPGSHREDLDLIAGGLDSLAGLVLVIAGTYVLRQRPRHALGWLMTGFGMWWALDSFAATWLAYATLGDRAGASAAFWVFQRLGAWLLLLLPLVLLLYPDGRLPTGRWRVVSIASLASTALLPLLLVVAPSNQAQLATESGDLPAAYTRLELDPFSLALDDEVWSVLLSVAYALVPLSLLAPFVLVVMRYRAATDLRRTQMRWLLWAAVVDVFVMLSSVVLPDDLTSWALTLCIAVTAGSVAIGLVRPDLFDIDLLLGNTLVYGGLLAVAFTIDLVTFGVVARSEGERLLIAAGVVFIVYAPLRYRLLTLLRRLLLGERDDPYRVVSGLAERLESYSDSEVQLLALARTVGSAFRISYVGVELDQADGRRLLVEDGDRPARTDVLPITYRGEQIGRLLLPSKRQSLRPGDERLLTDMVRQAATAARATQLADALQDSRSRMVTAVEDERRRLRNELHDGLGPTLAAIASRIDTARITAARAPEDADRMLGQAREEISGMLGEVRRLVHGLRPPALDDVGLAGAIRQQVDRLQAPGLRVTLETGGDLARLPAAVEVAAYRIVSESLTNVVRHASATSCVVRLSLADNSLVVEVCDDGAGIADSATAGVGLVSLRERAAELRGTCTVTNGPRGGTIVRATLPLAIEEGDA